MQYRCIGRGVNLKLEQEPDSWEQIKYWEEIHKANIRYKLPKETRPCISKILATSIEEGDIPGRSKSGLYIAVELRKHGFADEKIRKRLISWNTNNDPPMAEKEIRGILKQSEKKKRNGEFLYSPGCNKDLLIFCINKQDCEYYQKNFKIKGKREPNYLGQCWQYVLTSREREILFYVLPRMEGVRKTKKGNKIITTVRELNYWTGINQSYFNKILSNLANYGLIKYTPGSSRLWEHKATEIQRIIPPPEIPVSYRNNKTYKEYKKYMKEIASKANKVNIKM